MFLFKENSQVREFRERWLSSLDHAEDAQGFRVESQLILYPSLLSSRQDQPEHFYRDPKFMQATAAAVRAKLGEYF